MEKKYQVFISSTYLDLVEERQKVVEAILNEGHIPAGMELFKAGPTQEETIKEWIEESDIYVLILGPRYGSLNKDGISYTEWEYDLAIKLNKPMFSIVLKDNYIEQMVNEKRLKATDLETSNNMYVSFKDKVMSSIVVQVEHPAELNGAISSSIRGIEKRNSDNLEGWIKGSYLVELKELRSENRELSNKLVVRQDEVIEMSEKLSNVKDDFIGVYRFEYVKKELQKKYIDLEYLDLVVEKILTKKNTPAPAGVFVFPSENYDQELKNLEELKKVNVSALDALLSAKDKLIMDGIPKEATSSGEIYNKYYLASWLYFSLIELKPQNTSKKNRYTLNENGKKFINMIELEKKED